MARYLVTGGAGFIGSHLCDALLAGGHKVVILDDLSSGVRENVPDGCSFIEGDIRDADAVSQAMAPCDGCFHLAAIASVKKSVEEPLATHAVNLSATVKTFELAADFDIPVVYASSAAVYGDQESFPLSEDVLPKPLSPYAAQKIGSENYAKALGCCMGLKSFGLRFFNVYGPRQNPSSDYSGVISIFAERLKKGEDLKIFGDGRQSRDFIAVGDAVTILLKAMGQAAEDAPVANACTGRENTIRALAEKMIALSGSDAKIHHAEARAGDIRRSLGCPQRCRKIFGVGDFVELEEGLRALAG